MKGKRKFEEDNQFSGKRSLRKLNTNTNITDTFLAPLKDKIDGDFIPIVKNFSEKFQSQGYFNEISDLISKALGSSKPSPIDQRTFQKVNIHSGSGAGQYEPTNRTLDIYDKDSPFKTFIHEGTHALDNLHMRTYQKQALDFLAKHAKNAQGASLLPQADPGHWYEGARKILPSQIFNQGTYEFGIGKNDRQGYPDVKKSIINAANESSEEINPPKTYEQAKNNYQNLNGKDNQNLMPLSEFTAFAVENLNTPWKIKKFQDSNDYNNKDFLKNDHGKNLGRKFLKKMTKATYTGFKDLYNQEPEQQGQTFMQAYPAIHQAFVDRLSDLRNVTKYTKPEDYQSHLRQPGRIFASDQDSIDGAGPRPSSSSSLQDSASSSSSRPNFAQGGYVRNANSGRLPLYRTRNIANFIKTGSFLNQD